MKGLDWLDKHRLLYIKTNEIVPNPSQPRKVFEAEGLRELAESIRQLGVIQPLTVRRAKGGYELVAGERRLRAARMAGLTDVPWLLKEMDDQESSLIALVENLQRRDLDFFEEAEGLRRLIASYGLSQEEASRRIGKSQSAVANKLRLLRLDSTIMELIRHHGLTERHARALLRLDKDETRMQVLHTILKDALNVAQTDAYIDTLLAPAPEEIPEKPKAPRTLYIVKDIRVFMNTIDHAIQIMRSAGVEAVCQQVEAPEEVVLTIRIPRQQDKAKMRAVL